MVIQENPEQDFKRFVVIFRLFNKNSNTGDVHHYLHKDILMYIDLLWFLFYFSNCYYYIEKSTETNQFFED